MLTMKQLKDNCEWKTVDWIINFYQWQVWVERCESGSTEAWEREWWCWQVYVKLPARGERPNLGRLLKKRLHVNPCKLLVTYLSRKKSLHPGTAYIWAVWLLQQALRSVGAAVKRRYVVCGNCRKLTPAQHTQLKTAGLLWRFSHIIEQLGLKGNFEDHLVWSLC